MPRPTRVLVLGGSGLIGSHTVPQLLRLGIQVSTLSRRPYSPTLRVASGLSVHTGDIRDPKVLSRALPGVTDILYAVSSGVPRQPTARPMEDVESSLGPLLGLLETLRRSPDSRLFFLSSGGAVYGNPTALPVPEDAIPAPISPYGVLKLAAEKYIAMYGHLFGQQYCILRVGNAYGPRQKLPRGHGAITTLLQAAARGTTVRVFGDGTGLRDYIAADDVAIAFGALLARCHLPPVINVGSGHGTTLNELLTVVQDATGRRLRVQYSDSHRYHVTSIVLNIERLRTLVDFNPRPLAVGVANTWAQAHVTLRRLKVRDSPTDSSGTGMHHTL